MHFYAKQKKRREGMFALFENLTNWLWGLPLLITILVTGIYLINKPVLIINAS